MSKILLINNGYPSKKNPQYSTYIESICNCLLESQHEVDLLVLDTNFNSKNTQLLKYLKYYWQLLLKKWDGYDIIYIHNFPHSFLPIIFKLKKHNNIVIHWHGTDIFPTTKLSKILNTISYKFLKYIKLHFVPSDYFSKVVQSKLNLNNNQIIVSPSGGIDSKQFYPKIENNFSKKTICLGFASNLITEKGIDTVIDLLKQTNYIQNKTNKTIKVKCINYGVEKNKYVKILQQFTNVEIIEPLKKEQMISFYQSIDILLLPSRLSESLALVGLEAMSCNVPVVGTNDFAIKDYVINGVSGEKFENNNSTDFINSVITVINNILSYTPRQIILTKYSKEYVINQYKEIFKFNSNI